MKKYRARTQPGKLSSDAFAGWGVGYSCRY
jgi:hypothetical protein